MERTILLSGGRDNFTLLNFDLTNKSLHVIGAWPAPPNASWTEPYSSQGSIHRLVGLSEGEESGLLYTFEIDHARGTCKVTSKQSTLGAPAHFAKLHDQSALALSTYLGGSVALYPISLIESGGFLLADVTRNELFPAFPYEVVGHGPDSSRQLQCHVHQVLEDKKGLLYAPDLGSDRIWTLERSRSIFRIRGWLQCPPGTGPRHAVLNHDETILYVIGELSHYVLAFEISSCPTEDVRPLEGFKPSVIPPNVHASHQSKMDASEICTHPSLPNILYVSNRWERHIGEREPHVTGISTNPPSGDAVAVLLLSEDGRTVEHISWIRTNLDVIRGMRMSDDGRYMVVCGQEGGGVEVYEVKGLRGDNWHFMTSLSLGLDSGIKHAVWL